MVQRDTGRGCASLCQARSQVHDPRTEAHAARRRRRTRRRRDAVLGNALDARCGLVRALSAVDRVADGLELRADSVQESRTERLLAVPKAG